ncbi:potassium channel family protein [Trujillonella endophytica]|uniref:Ion channel n=1 Tax=Trujillonella endophytica TaxID=673521 RepID=A0A1H8T0Z6_9ACTN|nr:potassium channel family protein [Trujillella endophytica]SEO84582.1 Ion channel [Trujillella endophytica]
MTGDVGAWLSTAAGAALVLLVLRDVFDRLWHPSARGGLSQWLLAGVWGLTAPVRRRPGRSPRGIELTGSAAMAAVVGSWVVLVVVGWTLVYLPRMPEGFLFGGGEQGAAPGGALLDALYLSLVTLSTLGFGDVVPDAGWLRVVVPLEALAGFALLTAGVTWVLQIYPVLSRRRVLAARLALLRESVEGAGVQPDVRLLEDLAVELVRVRVDLVQHAETYYVADGQPEVSLAAGLEVAAALADQGRRSPDPEVRGAAALLGSALASLARLLDHDFLRTGGPVEQIVRAYAADHGHPFGERSA